MIILATGGRTYSDRNFVFKTFDYLHTCSPIILVIEGTANGLDNLVEQWCRKRGVPYLGVPAQWDTLGKAAGFKRNSDMLDVRQLGLPFDIPIDMVVHFPGGNGTADMVAKATAAGLLVWDATEYAT